ncbi:hypothetical protein EQU24_18010 [Methylotuvimicrobium buryatense]|uniref:Uncharacterized protein n=1 Tax=Methylotuvimicrobium buryatense TaxID=95641 RepID=A0A4P9UYF0_METBY|nr:hypothetical protein EQU24_18010 [Methylotuvimicrobium buryatense]
MKVPGLIRDEKIRSRIIPFTLQISALAYGSAGVIGKGFASMDAGIEPTWTFSRRPLTVTSAPNFDLRWV